MIIFHTTLVIHSYLAPYLYVQKGFCADALIHFGTHGNLEFTPGRDAGMRKQDWSSQLIGAIPHFYYYTTGNIGEAVIAKHRSHAALLTYLTPSYAESGMRQKYATLLSDVHRAVESGGSNQALVIDIKKRIINEGLHRSLSLDSIEEQFLPDGEDGCLRHMVVLQHAVPCLTRDEEHAAVVHMAQSISSWEQKWLSPHSVMMVLGSHKR